MYLNNWIKDTGSSEIKNLRKQHILKRANQSIDFAVLSKKFQIEDLFNIPLSRSSLKNSAASLLTLKKSAQDSSKFFKYISNQKNSADTLLSLKKTTEDNLQYFENPVKKKSESNDLSKLNSNFGIEIISLSIKKNNNIVPRCIYDKNPIHVPVKLKKTKKVVYSKLK
jgi:hypothetical protein